MRKGFPIIELMVVLSVLALLLACAAPTLVRYAENHRQTRIVEYSTVENEHS